MSGSLNSIFNNISFALQLHSEALFRLQEQASTGSRVNRVSDDPSAAYQIMGLNSENKSLADYIDTLSEASSTLEVSSSVIQQMTSTMAEVKVKVSQIVSGIYSQDGRERTAEVINDALEQLVQLANTKHNGQYLFGGGSSGQEPYAVERTNGEITSITYQGSSEQRPIEAAPGVQSSALYVGDAIFRSDERGEPIFVGGTGAAAGTGTSSVKGDVWLTVVNDGSNYKLSIDDGASYVTVPAGGEANQAVTDSRTGRVLYVDSTQIDGTGVELVRVPGSYDVFNSLITIRDILKNERGLSDAQLEELRNNAAQSLDEVNNLLVQAETSMGSRIGFLGNLKEGLEGIKANTEDETTRLGEADIAQVAIDLSRQQVLYQMSLAVAGKLMSLSLLDYMSSSTG
jgi:flagellar hook-associated protein 3 FlgL